MKATWGQWYWPLWMVFTSFTLLGPEIFALITNHQNTLSDYVWRGLDVTTDQQAWTAAHYLVFGGWVVLFSWLTFHFFFRRFT